MRKQAGDLALRPCTHMSRRHVCLTLLLLRALNSQQAGDRQFREAEADLVGVAQPGRLGRPEPAHASDSLVGLEQSRSQEINGEV